VRNGKGGEVIIEVLTLSCFHTGKKDHSSETGGDIMKFCLDGTKTNQGSS